MDLGNITFNDCFVNRGMKSERENKFQAPQINIFCHSFYLIPNSGRMQ